MVKGSLDFYESNMKLLKKHHLNTWKIIRDSDSEPIGEIVTAGNGKANLKVETDNKDILFFHDTINPENDGEQFLKIVPENAKGTVIFQGMGLGYGPLAVIEKREDIRHLIIFELSVGIFLQALKVNNLSPLIKDPRVTICLDSEPNTSEVLARSARSMRLEEISMLSHNPSCLFLKEGYERLGKEIFSVSNQFNISSNTFKAFGTDFIANRLSFLSMIHHTSLIDSIRGRFKDVPALLVSAGPSLDKNIDLIKEFKEKAVIISVDSALPALLANGVTPDFVTSIDYKNLTYEKIASCAPKSHNISMICSSWVGQKVAKVFPARNIYWTFAGGAMDRWINQGLGGKIVSPGAGTVAHLNLVAAVIMGCSPVIFTGQDLAFPKQAGSNDHTEHAVLKSDKKAAALLENEHELIWIDGNDGDKVPTLRYFVNFLHEFENMIRANPGKYINATEGGAFIAGTDVMTLKEVLNQFCTKEFDISKKMEESNSNNKIGNIDRFLKEIKSVFKIINEMNRLIKKSDKLSDFLTKKILKLQASPKRYSSYDTLPQNLQKKLADFDTCHNKMDKKIFFWELFDEATMNALQSTDRMKHEIDQLQDDPAKYIEWLLKNLNRLEEVNRVRKNIIKDFGNNLSHVMDHHKKETAIVTQIDNSKTDQTSARMDLARLYFEAGNLAHAKTVLSKVREHDPDNAEACYYIGMILAIHTEFDTSAQYFATATENDPLFNEKIAQFKNQSGDEYLNYAASLWAENKEISKNMMLKGLKFCPDHAQLINELSAILTKEMQDVESFLESGNEDDLSSIITQWMGIFDTQPELEVNLLPEAMGRFHKNCGKFFLVTDNVLNAFESFHKALSLSVDNPEYHMLLSDLLFKMGKNDQAISHYQKAIDIDKEFVTAYENRKKIKGAESLRAPDNGMKLIEEGDQFLRDSKFEDAVKSYEKSLLLEPDNPNTYHNIGVAYMGLGRLEKAIESYEKTILLSPENFNAYYNLGLARQNTGNVKEAVVLYKKAIELKPDFVRALSNLGNAYHSLGNFQEAIHSYEKTLEINPEYVDVINNLGVVYQAMGMLEKAVSYYKKFLAINPDNIEVQANLDRILQETK